jgi:hypothetical protein
VPTTAGLVHAAAVSFLASRLAPAGAFWVALAGGIALARVGARSGGRAAYGGSLAAMVETVAVMGPARISGPLTQALNAPVLGVLHARGRGPAVLLAACAAIRLAHYAVLNVFVLWLVVGGIDEAVATYDRVVDLAFGVLPSGRTAAIALFVATNLAAAVFYSAIQVVVVRRALGPAAGARDAAAPVAGTGTPAPAEAPALPPTRRRDRGLALATVLLWGVLLAVPAWPVLGGASLLLGVGTALVVRAGGWPALRLGALLAGALALGALGPALIGAVDLEDAARRALRAALLVQGAALAQAIIGPDGVRALAGAGLRALRRLPAMREAAVLAPLLRADDRLVPGTKVLLERVAEVAPAPRPLADVVIAWVDEEAGRQTPTARRSAMASSGEPDQDASWPA